MSAAHTRGPWSVRKDGRPELNNQNHVIEAADGAMVCYYRFASESDAHLIAAAPDLLEVMSKRVKEAEQRAFEDWLSRTKPSGDVAQVQDQWEESFACADFRDEWKEELHAIAKAKATGAAS
jgi:hypothetical protein